MKISLTNIVATVLSLTCCVVFPTSSQAFVTPGGTPLPWKQHQHKLSPVAAPPHDSQQVLIMPIPTTSRLSATSPGMNQPENNDKFPINLGLIGQNIANQALIGSTIWTGGPGYQILTQGAHFGPFGVLLGIAGVVPLLALSRQIETSESYLVSGLNLSTNMAVLRLFGPTPQPVLALLVSALLAGLTGVVEEVTFRGQLIPFFANRFGEGDIFIGAVLATFLFAVLHTNPLSFLKGGEAFLDNAVLLALQVVNGAVFAVLYLATGNLAVPIVAHALYDFYTFYKTHMVDVAGQMEYAEQQKDMPAVSNPKLEKRWLDERGQEFVHGVKQTFYLMDTNRDGVLSRKELRVALFSYGINLSPEQSVQVAEEADVDGSGAIDLDEFLDYVGPTGSAGKAVRNTLFGPL
jgi:membrane protease YdiL (CAAX protease family)